MTLHPLRHLSHSGISDYIRCPLLWAGRRVFGWTESRTDADLAMALGSAMHTALSAYHCGDDPELKLLEVLNGTGINKGHGIRRHVPTAQLAILLAVLGRYQEREEMRDGDRPAVWFEIDVPGVPLKFVGEFDLLRADNTIGEWKTGRSKWDQAKVDLESQATAYWLAYTQTEGHAPEAMVYHNLITGGPKTGSVSTFTTTRNELDLVGFEALCQASFNGMTSAPLLALCLKQGAQSLGATPDLGYCQFRDHCPRWGADIDQLSERYVAWVAAHAANDFERTKNLGQEIEGLLQEHEPEAGESE